MKALLSKIVAAGGMLVLTGTLYADITVKGSDIRRNEHVSLTLYRDGMSGEALRSEPRLAEPFMSEVLPLRLALPGAQA